MRWILPSLSLAPMLVGCTAPPARPLQTPSELAAAESLYADLRDGRDRIDVALAANPGPRSGFVVVPEKRAAVTVPPCSYDAPSIARQSNGLDSLRGRLYACYAWAQSHVFMAGDTLDRLTVLGLLGRTDNASRRRELFLALEPVWRGMNGSDGGIVLDVAWALFEIRMQRDKLPIRTRYGLPLPVTTSGSSHTPSSPGGACEGS